MEASLSKLRVTISQLLVDCFRGCLLTIKRQSIHQSMVVGCLLTILQACLLTIQEVDCLGLSLALGCLQIMGLLQTNQKPVDCSVALHHHQVLAVSSTSKQAVYHQSKTLAHHYSVLRNTKMTTTTLATAHNSKQPKTSKLTQQKAQLVTNTKKHAN